MELRSGHNSERPLPPGRLIMLHSQNFKLKQSVRLKLCCCRLFIVLFIIDLFIILRLVWGQRTALHIDHHVRDVI